MKFQRVSRDQLNHYATGEGASVVSSANFFHHLFTDERVRGTCIDEEEDIDKRRRRLGVERIVAFTPATDRKID